VGTQNLKIAENRIENFKFEEMKFWWELISMGGPRPHPSLEMHLLGNLSPRLGNQFVG